MIVYPREFSPGGLVIGFVSVVMLTTGLQTAYFCSGPTADAADVSSAAPSWLNSTAGVNDAVLSPWTAVEVVGDEVSIWGRKYAFGGLPFPRSVITRDTEVLAAPIRLSGKVSGKPLDWTDFTCRTVEAKPNVVVLVTRADSAGLACEGAVSVEYDGMVRVDWKLVPSGGKVSIEQLALEIPLRREFAKYLHHWPGRWGSVFNSRSLPDEGYEGAFKPFFWLGDERRGLAWFCESDRNFFNRQNERVIEIGRDGDTVVFRVNLITEPRTIESPLEYTFGFQATPVKPKRPDVWDYRICHMGAYGLEDRLYVPDISLRYPAKGHVRLDQGTFECRVRPQFDTQPDVKRDDPQRGALNRNLLDISVPGGGQIGFYWNIDDRGMRLYYKQGDKHPLVLTTHSKWQAGEWHHVAFTWGDVTRVYIDGVKLAERQFQGTVSGELDDAWITLGNGPCEMDVDEIRLSSTARDAFDLNGPPAADDATLLLDRFDEIRVDGSERTTLPEKGDPGVTRCAQLVDAEFGRAVSFSPETAKSEKVLDRLAEAGVRTICFHEQWTDIQAYPKTTHGERLKSLVKACHDREIQLLLYLGYLMSTIAPEWDAYHEQCLVDPRRGEYKRKYQPEPEQAAYMVCYGSVWQDFIAHHLQELVDEYDIDGVYLDGTSEPWGCRNERHGCGFKRADGTIGQTFSVFETRSMMKRIYTIVKSHNPGGQVNVHQSTCMTIPTLSFATSYWDGEHLQNVSRSQSSDKVLPLDAFRCEFMGHNWGVPAELLHYSRGPFKRFEAVGMALLHDIPVRPATMADIDLSAKLWRAMDTFGRHEATWLPYWEDHAGVLATPSDVKVSLYNRPGHGMIAVVANLSSLKREAHVAVDLAALGQPNDLAVSDILAENEVPLASGKLTVALDPLQFVVLRFKPR